MCSDGWFPSYVLEPLQRMSLSGSSEVCENIFVRSELCTGKGRKVVHSQGSWFERGHFINPRSQISQVLWVPSLAEGQENENNWQRVEKGGQKTDDMPPSSRTRLHFSNSFTHGCMPGMRVVGMAFKNMPGDKNSLVLKASLLEKRGCIEGPQLLPLFWEDFWDRMALRTSSGYHIISLMGKGSSKELSTKDQLREVLWSTFVFHQKINISNSFILLLRKEVGSSLILHVRKFRYRRSSSHPKPTPPVWILILKFPWPQNQIESNQFANLCKKLKGSCAPLADTAGVSKMPIPHHTIYYQQEVLRHSVLLEKISLWMGPIKPENQRHSKNRSLPAVEAMGLPRCPKPNFTDFKGTISHNGDSMRPAGWN